LPEDMINLVIEFYNTIPKYPICLFDLPTDTFFNDVKIVAEKVYKASQAAIANPNNNEEIKNTWKELYRELTAHISMPMREAIEPDYKRPTWSC
jgi:hypothetical protein